MGPNAAAGGRIEPECLAPPPVAPCRRLVKDPAWMQHPKPGREETQTLKDRKATCSRSSGRVPWVHYLSLASACSQVCSAPCIVQFCLAFRHENFTNCLAQAPDSTAAASGSTTVGQVVRRKIAITATSGWQTRYQSALFSAFAVFVAAIGE